VRRHCYADFVFIYGHDVTAGNIAEFSPENPLLGAVFLLSLYALKRP
jgi:hypothetical protein